MLVVLLLSSVSVFADTLGWVEVKADVPDDFSRYMIVTITNDETLEEYDIAVLGENGYFVHREVPHGTYTVSAAWVFQDYRFQVTPDVTSITVDGDAAAPIHLSVTMPSEEERNDAEDDLALNTEEETSDAAIDTEVIDDEEKERGLVFRLVCFVIGTTVFVGLIYALICVCRKLF